MASTGRKWLVGCGVGCGLMIVVLGGIGTCGYFSVKRVVDRAENIETSFNDLDEAFGKAETFVPAPDGRIPADRVDAFLAVRERLAAGGGEAAETLAALDPERGAGTVAKIMAGLRLIPAMMGYLETRNAAMLEEGMGLGEYDYLYALSYFSLLGRDVADGPGFTLSDDDDEEEDDDGPRISWSMDEDPAEVRRTRALRVRRQLNESQGALVRRQLQALAPDADAAWRETLTAEVAAMEQEPRRLLWEEGLPAPLRDSLEPYRERLEALYSADLNAVELGLVSHQ